MIVVSDSVATGTREDRSGPTVEACLSDAGFSVIGRTSVPDGARVVGDAIVGAARGFAGLIVTVGGTGFAPRDQTPEGTAAVLERDAPGLAEAMRAADARGRLTRGRAGTLGRCVVCNLPGSPDGARTSLLAVLDVLPHALGLLGGEPHTHP